MWLSHLYIYILNLVAEVGGALAHLHHLLERSLLKWRIGTTCIAILLYFQAVHMLCGALYIRRIQAGGTLETCFPPGNLAAHGNNTGELSGT